MIWYAWLVIRPKFANFSTLVFSFIFVSAKTIYLLSKASLILSKRYSLSSTLCSKVSTGAGVKNSKHSVALPDIIFSYVLLHLAQAFSIMIGHIFPVLSFIPQKANLLVDKIGNWSSRTTGTGSPLMKTFDSNAGSEALAEGFTISAIIDLSLWRRAIRTDKKLLLPNWPWTTSSFILRFSLNTLRRFTFLIVFNFDQSYLSCLWE